MSMGLALQQLALTVPPPEPEARERPTKIGFCTRCRKDGQPLRFARWGKRGGPVFNNYCTACHKDYCRDARERKKQSTTKEQ